MLPKRPECSGCALETIGQGFAPPEGPVDAPICLVGQALGADEARLGRNFVGQAGGMLSRILNLLGWDRSQIRIVNTVACYPPGDWLEGAPWEAQCIRQCAWQRAQWLAEPHQVFIPVGGIPLRALLDLPKAKNVSVQNFHGTVNHLPDGRFVVPTYHPSFLQRGAHNLIGTVIWDLQQAQEVLAHGKPTDPASLVVDPPVEWFEAWVNQALAAIRQDPAAFPISVDIETPDTAGRDEDLITVEHQSYTIERVNLACHPDEGLTVPFVGPYIDLLRRLLAEAYQWYWNGGYDEPRLIHAGVIKEEHRSRWLDLMWCLHRDTPVVLWNGTVRRIADLVRQREPAVLVGMDAAGERIPVKVVAWHRTVRPKQQWLRIKSYGTRYSFVCTPDHRVWTERGWVRAAHLRTVDRIRTHKIGSDALIHGTLLGDGYVDDAGTLQLCHGASQRAWNARKARHLGVRPFDRNYGYVACTSPVGRDWRDRFYRTDRTKRFLAPPSDAALAVWYCDDGSYHRNQGNRGLGRIRLACQAFNTADRQTILQWFRGRFGTQSLRFYQQRGTADMLHLGRDAVRRFFQAVAPWVPPEMEYKLPESYRGQYNGWLEKDVPRWSGIEWIREDTSSESARYCVTVDHPTHRFFVRGGLVSNCWHVLQSDLPRGLGFTAPFYSHFGPWKHLSASEPAKYGAIDGLQTHRCGFGIIGDLVKSQQWSTVQRHVHQLHWQALHPAREIGVGINRTALLAFKADLTVKATTALDALQTIYPAALRPLTPKQGLTARPAPGVIHVKASAFTRKGKERKGKPANEIKLDLYKQATVVEQQVEREVLVCRTCGAIDVARKHRCKEEYQKKDGTIGLRPSAEPALVELDTVSVTRWYWQEPFNPDSNPQILAYLRFRGHLPGKAKKTRKDTTNRETLERLEKTTKDPFYRTLLDYRAVQKVKSTYVDGTERRLDANDRVHPEPTFKPSTQRLSYINPNITNVVSDRQGPDALAAGFRRCVVAAPGCRLVEVDYSAIEAVEVGWYCRDPQYLRLAKLGVHAGLASHVLGRPYDPRWSDPELAAYFKSIKKAPKGSVEDVAYNRSKRFIHGFSYGLSLRGMVLQFPEIFPTLTVAGKYADIFHHMAPAVGPWQQTVRQLAARQHYLGGSDHPFRYKHWFWSVFTYSKISTGQYYAILKRYAGREADAPVLQLHGQPFRIGLGEDAKRCIAFLPQSTAAGVLKEAILRLFDPDSPSYIGDAYYGRTPLRAPIHDSLLLEIPDRIFDRVYETVCLEMQRPILQQPCPEEWGLGPFLTIGVGAKVGPNWQSMEDLAVPVGVSADGVREAIEEAEQEDWDDLARMGASA